MIIVKGKITFFPFNRSLSFYALFLSSINDKFTIKILIHVCNFFYIFSGQASLTFSILGDGCVIARIMVVASMS